jgi:cephalosporin hydroxylase
VKENDAFNQRNDDYTRKMAADQRLAEHTQAWFDAANAYEYSYHFSWLSRPIIQYPQDIVATQELIWKVKPDLIIETGIAHGGSLIFSASMLALMDYCDAAANCTNLDPSVSCRKVVGVDIDIRAHNKAAIENHPLSHMIHMIEGSSIDQHTIERVRNFSKGYQRILVLLDSNHTHDHVLAELEAYAPLTSMQSYCVVFDTAIEYLPADHFTNRPWAKGNNPKTARDEYLMGLQKEPRVAVDGKPLNFEVDSNVDNKLLISVAPGGYLRRI